MPIGVGVTCGVDFSLRSDREEGLLATDELNRPQDRQAFTRGRRLHLGAVDATELPDNDLFWPKVTKKLTNLIRNYMTKGSYITYLYVITPLEYKSEYSGRAMYILWVQAFSGIHID
jgi:hypothetical protein